uniref:Reverse transcriptase domain-containing protein n=1 Tax=Cannabis sativa TaxID=3483 RepID=A0A803P9G6_CANSA
MDQSVSHNHHSILRLVGIDPNVITHILNLDKNIPAKREKRRLLDETRYATLKKEVEKLLASNFIRESFYPIWVANPFLVPKPNGKWRTCIDFTDVNKAGPKDCFSLQRIDQLVDATARHELMSFMDTYSGYNQIVMNIADQEHTSFITGMGLYCYNVMPFGLKNVGTIYQ